MISEIKFRFSFLNKIQTLTPYEGFKAYAFIGATAILLIALYNFILQILDWKWTAKFFAIILVFIGGFSAYFVNSLGVVIYGFSFLLFFLLQ